MKQQSAFPWQFLLLTLSASAIAAPAAVGKRAPSSGLEPDYREFSCAIRGRTVHFQELRFEPGHGLELRAVRNPGAHPDPHCANGYGGSGLDELLRSLGRDAGQGFTVLGAVNGSLYHEAGGGYASNTLLWSAGQGLIAPLRRGVKGTHLFVADAQGGHDVLLSPGSCGTERTACARFQLPEQASMSAQSYRSAELITQLQATFPTMTLALQSNMPLMDGHLDTAGHFSHYTRCPAPNSNDWRCSNLPRTVLCAGQDGWLSLITTAGAYPVELAEGLRAGGSCAVQCTLAYNLDGGGSTQMARWNAGISEFVLSGRRVNTGVEGCSPYRPDDNYLVVAHPDR
jgi:hypothetical protein